MLRLRAICAVVLLWILSANSFAVEKISYPGAIFIADKAHAFDKDQLAKKFPNLTILTDVPRDNPPDKYFVLMQPPIADFGLPDAERIKYRGIGLSSEQKKWLTSAQCIWATLCVAPRADAIGAVREADRIMLDLAEQTDGVIYDDTTRQYYSKTWWQTNRIATWEGDVPDISKFVTIDFYQFSDGPAFRAISLGMSKFGLPDVVVNNLARSHSGSMGGVMNLAMQTMVERGAPTPAQPSIAVNLDEIRHRAFRQAMEKTLLKGAQRKGSLSVAPAKHEEGDPEGPLLELTFDGFAGQSPTERQDAAISTLFGSEERISKVHHDEELVAASKLAREKLPEVRKRFLKGLGLGERLLVKAPFQTITGGREFMWVEVNQWPDGEVKGLLMNDPVAVPSLKSGAPVSVKQDEVFDYIIFEGEKIIEGGETSRIIERRDEKTQP